MLFTALVFGGLGAIIGSFLNVLVLRKGVASLQGRSHCPSCGKNIAAYDLVPIFSWFILRGRCRNCGSGISFQYPLVEATTAILFALVAAVSFPEYFVSIQEALILFANFAIVALLVAISIYDIRHTIIPDEWVYSFGALALLVSFLHAPNFMTIASGPIAALPLFVLWLVSRGAWMGLGDPKLALGIGWLLGFPTGIIGVFASFILGSLVLVPLLIYERVTHKGVADAGAQGLTMKSEVPFAPFIILGAWISLMFRLNLLHVVLS